LIASLLPEAPPANLKQKWPVANPNDELDRTYFFKFLPIAFMGRLIIRTLHFATAELLWRDGMLISKGSERALVTYDMKTTSVRMIVRGEAPVVLLEILKDSILENL
jgi:hypothetical protein